jgi:hypothetical protein
LLGLLFLLPLHATLCGLPKEFVEFIGHDVKDP